MTMSYQQSMQMLAAAQNDALVGVEFYLDAQPNAGETKKQGRAIFDDVEMVRIKFAGDKTRIHCAPAHERFKPDRRTDGGMGEWLTYAQEYAPVYQRFKAGLDEQGTGTPLSEVPFLTAAKRSELKALNITSLEALAALDGTPLRSLGMGGRDLKNQAQAYIDAAAGSADVTALAAENAGLKARMEEMEAMMREMQNAAKSKDAEAAASSGDADPSPFDDFDDDALREWLTDSKFPVDKRWSRATLIQKANEANAELKARAEKVAA